MAVTALSGQRWQGNYVASSTLDNGITDLDAGNADSFGDLSGFIIQTDSVLDGMKLDTFKVNLAQKSGNATNPDEYLVMELATHSVADGSSGVYVTKATYTSTTLISDIPYANAGRTNGIQVTFNLTSIESGKTNEMVGGTAITGDRIYIKAQNGFPTAASGAGSNLLYFDVTDLSGATDITKGFTFNNTERTYTFCAEFTQNVEDDKATVTDVPVGSQFEETNTRKFYQMGESNVSGTSLKAYYKMNGSSTTEIVNVASTVTGNSTLGTDANIDLINAPTPSVTGTPTNLGTSYTFNGTDELGKMGDSGDLSQWTFMHNQTASFTFNVWIKFPSGTQPVNNKYFWDNSRETDTVPSFQIRGKGGFWRVIVSQGASGGWVMSTDDNPQLDCPQDQEWHMYTFTYDYLNTPNFTYRVDANTSGTYYETKNNSSQNASNSDAPVQPYFFATQNTGGGTTGWQAGTACELAIWDRILTSAEITTLYASGDGLQLDTGLKVWTERGTAI